MHIFCSLINARSKWLPVEEEVLYKTAQIDGPTQEPPKDFEVRILHTYVCEVIRGTCVHNELVTI